MAAGALGLGATAAAAPGGLELPESVGLAETAAPSVAPPVAELPAPAALATGSPRWRAGTGGGSDVEDGGVLLAGALAATGGAKGPGLPAVTHAEAAPLDAGSRRGQGCGFGWSVEAGALAEAAAPAAAPAAPGWAAAPPWRHHGEALPALICVVGAAFATPALICVVGAGLATPALICVGGAGLAAADAEPAGTQLPCPAAEDSK